MIKYNIPPSIKKYGLAILPSVIIIGIWSVLFPSYNQRKWKEEIKDLQSINKELKKKNDSILYHIESLKIDMERSDEIIHTLFDESKEFEEKADSLTKSIKSIKNKYEKASNHANGFGSNEIVGYFSNL